MPDGGEVPRDGDEPRGEGGQGYLPGAGGPDGPQRRMREGGDLGTPHGV